MKAGNGPLSRTARDTFLPGPDKMPGRLLAPEVLDDPLRDNRTSSEAMASGRSPWDLRIIDGDQKGGGSRNRLTPPGPGILFEFARSAFRE
jgi:hypothetical protein